MVTLQRPWCRGWRRKEAESREERGGRQDHGSWIRGYHERQSLYIIIFHTSYVHLECSCSHLLLTNAKPDYIYYSLSRSPPCCIRGPTHCLQKPRFFNMALHRIFLKNVDTASEGLPGQLMVGLGMSATHQINISHLNCDNCDV